MNSYCNVAGASRYELLIWVELNSTKLYHFIEGAWQGFKMKKESGIILKRDLDQVITG